MKIKTLLLTVMFASVVSIAINAFSLISLVKNVNEQADTFETQSTILQLKEELVTVSDFLTERARAYMSTEDERFYDEYMEEVNEKKTYVKTIAELEAILPANILEYVKQVQAESGRLAQIEMEAFDLTSNDDKPAAIQLMYSSDYFSGKDRINADLERFDVEMDQWIDNRAAVSAKNVKQSISIVSAVVILTAVFYIWASITIIMKLRPLTAAIAHAEEIAEGNLTVQPLSVKTGSRDEISQLSSAFNTMLVNLKEMMATVHDAGLELSASAEQLNANVSQSTAATEHVASGAEQVASGAAEQFQKIEESSRAISEVAIGVQQTAVSASDAAASSAEVSKQAADGGKRLQSAISQMEEIDYAVDGAMTSIQSLSAQSQEIEQIVSTITSIADQTNLLALNAAIEAARAGESGKGFAVVADEVRNLAEQSSISAKEIASIIQAIQSNTNTTVEQMNSVNSKVSEGTETIHSTGNAFESIISAVANVTNQIQEVSAMSQQMSASTEQISATFETIEAIVLTEADVSKQLAAASEEQLASMEEISAASEMLTNLSERLSENVAKFRL